MTRLVTLGTKGGPSIRKDSANPTATLLEMDGRRIVIDCGLGVTRALVQAGIALKTLDAIFITHLHSDHVLELGPLIHTAWTCGLVSPVTVYGPPGLRALWDGFLASLAYDTHLRVVDDGRVPLAGLVTVIEVAPGPIPFAGPRVSALAVPHPPVDHAFAFRFDGAHAVTLSGDTAYHPPLADFARGSDILLHEALLPDGIEALLARIGGGDKLRAHMFAAHTSAPDAARIAAAAGVGHLVLNHLIPVDDPAFTPTHWQAACAPHFAGQVTVAHDGMEVLL
jgi:ribonuclease BN (tRNA processing enzyme)